MMHQQNTQNIKKFKFDHNLFNLVSNSLPNCNQKRCSVSGLTIRMAV